MISHSSDCTDQARNLYVRGTRAEGQNWRKVGGMCMSCGAFEIIDVRSRPGTAAPGPNPRRSRPKKPQLMAAEAFLEELRRKQTGKIARDVAALKSRRSGNGTSDTDGTRSRRPA